MGEEAGVQQLPPKHPPVLCYASCEAPLGKEYRNEIQAFASSHISHGEIQIELGIPFLVFRSYISKLSGLEIQIDVPFFCLNVFQSLAALFRQSNSILEVKWKSGWKFSNIQTLLCIIFGEVFF